MCSDPDLYPPLNERDPAPTAERSALMGRIKGKNTAPELIVRRAAHRRGLRFRLHRNDLPGTPDIVFPRYRVIIFVHGCFWHRHAGCERCTTPKTRVKFWTDKFRKNVERDQLAAGALERAGWHVLTIWECQTRDEQNLNELFDIVFSLGPIAANPGLDTS